MVRTSNILMIGAMFAGVVAVATPVTVKTVKITVAAAPPPLGLACFVIHSNLQDERIRIEDVFWGAVPFAITMLLVLLLIVAVPEIATALV